MSAPAGTRASVRNVSLNMACPVISRERAHLDAGLVHVDGEAGDALVLGASVDCPGDEHAVVGGLAERRPDLLAVDDPLVAVRARPGWCSPARSEPAPGSLNSWHHAGLAGDDVADVVSICSGVPWSAMVGAASSSPSP